MSCALPAHGLRILALTALAGATAVTGTLVLASPAVAAPVAIEEHLVAAPGGLPPTGAAGYYAPVRLSNGDTAYGINEHQPLAPVGKRLLDDEDYAVARPVDEPAEDRWGVVGEKAGDSAVYWEAGNAALAGYVLSVFGATGDADEALAVHWAVRSLSTAAAPAPELSGVEQSHRDRAEAMVQDARDHTAAADPQESHRADVVTTGTGRPTALSVRLPEAADETTVTLEGPATFADGTTTATLTGEPRERTLELAVAEDVPEGELTAVLTTTVPSTELTVLADDEHRDLLIAGQRRPVTWSAGASFTVDVADEQADEPGPGAPAEVTGPAPGDAGPGGGARAGGDPAGPAEERTAAVVETVVQFREETETRTEVVTETTETAADTTGGPGPLGEAAHAAYADPVTANTGTGAAAPAGGRITPVVLAGVALAAGTGAWALRRRRPTAHGRHSAAV